MKVTRPRMSAEAEWGEARAGSRTDSHSTLGGSRGARQQRCARHELTIRLCKSMWTEEQGRCDADFALAHRKGD